MMRLNNGLGVNPGLSAVGPMTPDPIAAILAQQEEAGRNPGTFAPINEAQSGSAPSEPFFWAQGGKRLSMDDIALDRKRAAQQQAVGSDYSPVQSWTQGAARFSQAIIGALGEKQAEKDAAAYAQQRQQDIASLLLDGQGRSAGSIPENLPDTSATLPSITDGVYQEGQPAPDPVAAALARNPAPSQGGGINPAIIAALSSDDPVVNSLAGKSLDRYYAQNTPQYFMSGKDRVMFNPGTGESQTVYDAQQDFQEYADSLGLEPGTDEYNEAQQDFVLRANGPTAIQGRTDLENTRQGNRVSLEGVRQGNRRELRQTPTYSNMHPTASGGGKSGPGGGFGLRPPRNPGNVYAPIMDKVARGIPLSPGEQQVLSMRGRGSRSASGAPAAPAAPPTAMDAKGNKMQWNGKAWVSVK